MTFPVVTQGQYTEPRQYENIILRGARTAARSCASATSRAPRSA